MNYRFNTVGSVPATQSHTRTSDYQRITTFVLMLFLLMMKIDVGWGQGNSNCPNLIVNPTFLLDPNVTDGFDAFCENSVNGWKGVDFTPHVVQIDPNNSQYCDVEIVDINNTVACLRSGPVDEIPITESIAQDGLLFSLDPFVTYYLDVSSKLLECGRLNSSTNLDVYILNSTELPSDCINPSSGWIPTNSQIVANQLVNWYNNVSTQYFFQPTDPSFNSIYIRSWKPFDASEGNQTVLGLSEVNLTCTTVALTDLNINNTSGLNYSFEGVNASSMSTFSKYLWTMRELSTSQIVFTSDMANPNFTFANGGEYEVCLEIIDNNGCCGRLCEVVLVECEDPVATFNIIGNCPNYTFVPTNLNENFDYTWYINGQAFGSSGVSSYTFTTNGTYEIVLEVVNECGEVAKYVTSITVDCICPAPMADFNFAVNCVNRQGVTSFNVLNGQIGDSYLWSFGDGNTSTTSSPNIVHNYTTNQTFTVRLTVTNMCGKTQIITKSVVISCEEYCPQNDGRTQYTINGANGGINFSQALISLGVPINTSNINSFLNLNFVLVGDVTLDISAYFDNCKFIAMAGAQLILSPSAVGAFNKGSSQFVGCKFFGCTNMWKGIKDEGASASFYGCTIEDALYGIHAANSGSLIISGVSFSHNFIGVYLTSSASHTFAGNQFTGGTLKPKYNGYPSYANKNYAGIYAQGFTINSDGSFDFGCSYLTVGDNGGAPNTFSNLQNGIIQAGGFSTNIRNNIFSNLQGTITLKSNTNVSLNSNVQGVGILILGSGWLGMNIEKNVMTNGEYGVAILNSILASPIIKNYNQFTNFKNGLYITGVGGLGGKVYVTDHNSFNCSVSGIYFDQNYGPSFECKNNTFYQSSGIVLQAGSNGMRVNSLSGGTLGNFGQGLISGNNFFNSTPKHSNGMMDISQYGSVSVVGNKLFFMSASDLTPIGHGGLRLLNVSSGEVISNEFYNYTGTTFSGTNTLFNVAKSAVCCNETFGLHFGFSFGGTGTGNSTYSQNKMSGDFNGINIGPGVKLGDQIDMGNTWLGASRVANLVYGASGSDNRFYANPDQNYVNPPTHPTHPNQIVDFWPTQTPSVWFGESDKNASESCDLNQCSLPLANISGDTPPTAESIQVLEDILDDGHILIADHVAPGRWAKERWLYGYLTSHPYIMEYSETLASFYTDVPEDVKQYEDFYQEIADRISLPAVAIEALNTHKEQAQSLLDLHDTKWAAYQVSPSQSLYEELEAIRMQQGNMIPTAHQLMQSHRNGMQAYWEEMKAAAQSLPEDQPYTQVAKMYANIYIDQLLHGDEYVITHHIDTLQYIAGLCESLYKESVVLARNMLVHLGDYMLYDDQDICAKAIENRIKKSPSTLTISPNPTTGKVTIDNAGEIQAIEIRSAGGTLLRSLPGNQLNIDVTDLANGLYFITILKEKSEQVTKKLIKIN